MRDPLIDVGLTPQEGNVYRALTEIGPSKAGAVAVATRQNRTYVYDLLRSLCEKGLASSVVHNGRRIYHAAPPERLQQILEEKLKAVQQQKARIREAIKELSSTRSTSGVDTVQVFDGREGLRTILDEIVRTKADVWTYGSEGNFTKVLRYSFRHYLSALEESGIRMRVIFNKSDRAPFAWSFAEARYLPKEHQSPTETTIYGNTVIIFIFTDIPKAIVIRSPAVARSYRSYFQVLWDAAKPSTLKRNGRLKTRKEE